MRAQRRRGFTLIELILVMGIVGIVAGIGLGFFASFDPGRGVALGLVQNTLRSAQNAAVARRAPAAVRIDRENRVLRAESFEVVGTWHFEGNDLAGSRGLDGLPLDFPGDFIAEEGYVGRALDLELGVRSSRVSFPIEDDPRLEPRYGFALELALRPRTLSAGKILDLGSTVSLSTRADGGVEVEVTTRQEDQFGRPQPGTKVKLRSPGGVLTAERWTRIAVSYDRRSLRLLADDVPLVVRAEEREVWMLDGPLLIGDDRTFWPGRVDQLVVSTVTASDEVELPRSANFDPRTPAIVRFAAGGALDAAEHFGAVRFGITFDDGRVEDVVVNTFGTVE